VKGDVGPQGPKGERGSDGKDGLNGKDGAPGKDGINGKDGVPGAKGDQGVKGDVGPQGPKGERGSDGKDGLNGKDGAPGKDGAKGDVGPQGPKGDRGPDGKDGKLSQEDLDHIAEIGNELFNKVDTASLNVTQLSDDLAIHKMQNELFQKDMSSRMTNIEGRTTALENRMGAVESKTSQLEKRMKGAAAASAALMQTANVPQKPNMLALSIGLGHHEDAKAVAIGVAGATGLNPRVTMGYRAAVAISPQQKGPTFGVGTTFFFE
jgi:hypothetical protein